MPYLAEKDKKYWDNQLYEFLYKAKFDSPGELNYVFTMLAKKYLEDLEESYASYNDIIGAFECCKLEYYRRKVAAYEKIKQDKNGDVF